MMNLSNLINNIYIYIYIYSTAKSTTKIKIPFVQTNNVIDIYVAIDQSMI